MREIVKVQLSLASSEQAQQVLIYNEDNSILYEEPASKEIKKLLGKENKKFFYVDKHEDGNLYLQEEAAYQDW